MGASYGAGNYGMCGRAYDPRFLFTWPNAKSAVMGPAQLAGVLSIVGRQAAMAKGQEYNEEHDAAMRKMVEAQIEEQSLAAVPVREALRRRRDRPARHQDRARPLPLRCPQRTDQGRRRLRRLPDVMATMITTLLIANRGEIARRIIRTCRDNGIRTVAVFSDPDADAPHVARGRLRRAAARRVARPRPTCAATCSSPRRSRRARTPCTPATASCARTPTSRARCGAAGLTWVGPAPDAIEAMGSKVAAKKRMAAAGVPVLPELDPGHRRRDFPVLIKASAGGGGRGMRIVRVAAEFADAAGERPTRSRVGVR